jgi:hypothetical protein
MSASPPKADVNLSHRDFCLRANTDTSQSYSIISSGALLEPNSDGVRSNTQHLRGYSSTGKHRVYAAPISHQDHNKISITYVFASLFWLARHKQR